MLRTQKKVRIFNSIKSQLIKRLNLKLGSLGSALTEHDWRRFFPLAGSDVTRDQQFSHDA